MEGYSAKDSGTETRESERRTPVSGQGVGLRRQLDRAVPVRARARRCAGRTACHWRSGLP